MDNNTRKIIKQYINKAQVTNTPFTALLQTDDNIINVLVTTESFLIYRTQENDKEFREGAYSVIEYDSKGNQLSNKTGWLKYSWIDEKFVSHSEQMTIDERAEYDLAELLDDTSKSDIYALVKESEGRKKEQLRQQHAAAQARYRQKKKNDPDFKLANAKSTARYSAKIFINEYATISELETLKKLIQKREQELENIDK
ncbi:hypothetical protein AALM99_07015 [Lactococcus muris]|uniref:Uncharacterized protein n=1 Tax=Lactococcus muris TaxID=2941330 RepID=A0ABV4DA85_9LACT